MIALLALALAAEVPIVPPLAAPPTYREPVAEECPILAADQPLVQAIPCDGLLLPASAYRHLRALEVDADYARERWAADVATLSSALAHAEEREGLLRVRLDEARDAGERRERRARADGLFRGLVIGAGVGVVAGLVAAVAL